MSYLKEFNPTTEEGIRKRRKFDKLPDEEKREKVNRLHEKALIENCDSFYALLKKAKTLEEKEELELALKVCEAVRDEGKDAIKVIQGGRIKAFFLGIFQDLLSLFKR